MDHIKHIKRLMQRGWTQAQIATAASINRSTLIRSMRVGAEIKVSTLLAIMKVSGKAPAKEKQK
jgi:DNA-binding phage protein